MTEIKIISTAEHSAWDQYILSRAVDGTYLTTAWKRAVETGYGHPTFYLGAFGNGSVVGVLPLVLVKPPLVRGYLVSLPFCDYGGLLTNDTEVAHSLLDRAIDLANELRAGLEIRTTDANPVLTQHGSFVQITNKCRMVLDLPGSALPLWSGFKAKLRSQIRSAVNHGLVCRLSGEDLLSDFYRVFSRNMRDLGSPVHSTSWLQSVLVSFGTNARVGVVYKDASAVAAGIVLTFGRQATIPWCSSLREMNKLNANMLLYWNCLEDASNSGLSSFDFGRSSPGEGTYAFKRQWGAHPLPLHWFSYCRRCVKQPTQRTSASLQSVAEGLWKKLPLAIANVAGPRIRKFVSR